MFEFHFFWSDQDDPSPCGNIGGGSIHMHDPFILVGSFLKGDLWPGLGVLVVGTLDDEISDGLALNCPSRVVLDVKID